MLNDNSRGASDDMPRLCVSGCGYYGNPEKMFFCSMCYKSEELRIKNTPATHELKRDSSDKLTQESRNDLVAAGRDKKPSNPGRCFQCNKKNRNFWF